MQKPLTEAQMLKEVQKAKRFNDIAFAITLVILAAAVAIILILRSKTTFSQKRWSSQPNSRKYMVYSLLKEYSLVGMSQEDVHFLLGNSETGETDVLAYYLGNHQNSSKESWLILKLDSGNIQSYSIKTK